MVVAGYLGVCIREPGLLRNTRVFVYGQECHSTLFGLDKEGYFGTPDRRPDLVLFFSQAQVSPQAGLSH